MSGGGHDVCPVCGEECLFDAHVEACRSSAWRGDDACPMCGEAYESYLDHLKDCPAG